MITIAFGPDRIRVAPITKDAWQALARVLAHHDYHVRTSDTDSYNCRTITGGKGKSLHSFGIALDINWKTNPFKRTPDKRKVRFSDLPTQDKRAEQVKRNLADTDMTKDMIDDVLAIKTNNGDGVFEWGGYWKKIKDAMHFEIDLSPDDLLAGIDWLTVAGVSDPAGSAIEETRPMMVGSLAFDIAHPFIEKWEGGFVNHPSDPGGATNFGITRDTLSRWRGRQVSVDDVRNLTIDEARDIFRQNYWAPLRADEMPVSVALMTYNAGVNSGPSRGAKLLQKALNEHGQNLAVDGQVGALTLGAIGRVDERRLVDSFETAHESFYRGLRTFGTFGRGWLNRLTDVTAGARVLVGTSVTQPPVPSGGLQSEFAKAVPIDVADGSAASLAMISDFARLVQVVGPRHPGSERANKLTNTASDIENVLNILKAVQGANGSAPAHADGDVEKFEVPAEDTDLTPVNNALGATVGHALDGRKTGYGTLGLIATTVLPVFFPQLAPLSSMISVVGDVASSGALSEVGNAVQQGASTVGVKIMSVVQPIFAALTGWGVLGKMDKWFKK